MQSGSCRDERIDTRAILKINMAAVRSDRTHHKARVAHAKCFPIETKRFGNAEIKVFDEYIGTIDQCEELFALGCIVNIEFDAALTSGPHACAGFGLSSRITTGRFNLHDVRAVIRQQHRCHGARDPTCEINDPDSPQNSSHVWHLGRPKHFWQSPTQC